MRGDDRCAGGAGELGRFVGRDGFAMLALSVFVIVASGGITLLAAWLHVLHMAWTTSAGAAEATRILVLGYQLPADGRPVRVYRQRLGRAQALLSACPGAGLFLLGGRARPSMRSEAEAGVAYLQAAGVPAERLRREDRSRHTLENLRHYRDAFPSGPGERAVLVSSRFHLARAAMMAADLGLPCRPCAAEAKASASLRRPDRLLSEAFLLHWYVVGRTFSRWTGNVRMLARIS